MARTWVLEDSNTDTDQIAGFQNSGTFSNNALYFFTAGVGDPKVYRWSPGGGFELLTTTEFSGLSLQYMTWFNSALYVSAVDANHIYVYRYSGAAWSEVLDINHVFAIGDVLGLLDSDNDRIVISNIYAVGNDTVYASTNGTVWTAQTYNGGTFEGAAITQLFGRARRTASEVLLGSTSAGANIIAHSAGNNWTDLNAAPTTYKFIGEADSKSWFTTEGGDPAEYSTDWGVNTSTANGVDIDGGEVQVLGFVDVQLAYGDDVFGYDPLTVTWYADGTPNAGNDVLLLAGFGSVIYALVQNGDDVEIWNGGSLVSPAGLRLLGMAADSANLYVTSDDDDTLTLKVYSLASLALVSSATFGAATMAELDNRTYGLLPAVQPGADGLLFLRGRDGNDVKIQKSDDSGASFNSLDDGGWAADKFAVALLPDPLAPAELTAVFADDDIYRYLDFGAGPVWTKTGDAAVVQRAAALHPLTKVLILAGQAAGAGELHFSPNYGGTSQDISEATMGVINVIEVSL